jgi:hypothetical protein
VEALEDRTLLASLQVVNPVSGVAIKVAYPDGVYDRGIAGAPPSPTPLLPPGSSDYSTWSPSTGITNGHSYTSNYWADPSYLYPDISDTTDFTGFDLGWETLTYTSQTAADALGTVSDAGAPSEGSPLALQVVPDANEAVGEPVTIEISATASVATRGASSQGSYAVSYQLGGQERTVLNTPFSVASAMNTDNSYDVPAGTTEVAARIGDTLTLNVLLSDTESLAWTGGADPNGAEGGHIRGDLAVTLAVSHPNSLHWTGRDGTNWSDPGNWLEGQAPTNGATLVFPSTGRQNSNDDITGLQLSSIELQGPRYVLTGNALQLANGLTQDSGTNTYAIPTSLDGPVTFNVVGTL